jgi:hypothetical protein
VERFIASGRKFMLTSAARKTGIVTALVLAGLVISAASAFALCKYGTPHCVNPHPGLKTPKANNNQLPPDGWDNDPDCKYYKNCGYNGTAAAGPKGGHNGAMGSASTNKSSAHP